MAGKRRNSALSSGGSSSSSEAVHPQRQSRRRLSSNASSAKGKVKYKDWMNDEEDAKGKLEMMSVASSQSSEPQQDYDKVFDKS